MIGFFPDIYEDELLYSQLCRYYQRTGYTKYIFAVDDLFMRRTVHPVVEWVNEYSPDAMDHITKGTDFETVIRDHTMYPAYCRFLPKKRRQDALHSLMICDGNYHNLILGQNLRQKRFLRYCPVCAQEDRGRLGETYWHREHQIIHVDICPKHRYFLEASTIPIGSKVTPGLYSAEIEIPLDVSPKPCMNEGLLKFTQYILNVFHQPVDMETDVPIGSFLHSKLDDQYQSESKMKVYSTKLYEDYCAFFRDICEPMCFEGFRKVYNNYSLDHYRIYQLAYFQGISAEELTKRPNVVISSAMEEFYRDLASEYGIDFDTVTKIGDAVISKYWNLGKVARKSGPKQQEWAELDKKNLTKVKEIVDRIYCSGGKPGRISVTRVERELGIPTKQMQKLPKCTKYVEDHIETMNEFRARKVTWAVRLFVKEGRYLSLNKLNRFLNFRKNDLNACLDLITDPMVIRTINDLCARKTFTQREDS